MNTPEPPDRPGEPDTRPEVRIGDREREQAVAHLGRAFAEGRLDLVEYDERVASAYGAKTANDLSHLTADLPRERPAPTSALDERQSRTRARTPVQPRAGVATLPAWLRRLWLVYASVVAINLVIWLILGLSNGLDFPYFWPMWVAGPWGAVLLISSMGVKITAPDH